MHTRQHVLQHAHTAAHTPTRTRQHVLSVAGEDDTRRVVEQHADTVVTQLIAKSILVTVVHPFAHPVDGHGRRVLRFICNKPPLLTLHSLAYHSLTTCDRVFSHLHIHLVI